MVLALEVLSAGEMSVFLARKNRVFRWLQGQFLWRELMVSALSSIEIESLNGHGYVLMGGW